MRRSINNSNLSLVTAEPMASADRTILHEEMFHRMISLERKRTERSRKPFLLMLLDIGESIQVGRESKALSKILSALSITSRETDVIGWYKSNSIVGVMYTEITFEDRALILSTMMTRISESLRNHLNLEIFTRINLSFYLYPEGLEGDQSLQIPNESALYPDLQEQVMRKRWSRVLKRSVDIIGSLFSIILFSPVFFLAICAIKLTSKGPVFYKQDRVGEFGNRFSLIKFRSMYVNNSSEIHKEYVKKLIAGQAERKEGGAFKITNDPRITPLGRWMRRTSVDELPQFINVLRGEMSLVGPRPPLAYEVEAYDLWHRRRLLGIKPGITGLWQVNGRCRTKFDEMVRLDLQYMREQSLLLDLKILLRTPGAVLSGDGAY